VHTGAPELSGTAEPGSIVDSLLAELREVPRPAFHDRAWGILQRPCEELRSLEPDQLVAELGLLESTFRESRESELVRGACLVVLGRVAPEEWFDSFERRVWTGIGASSEIERAFLVALAQRRDTELGLSVDLSGFSSSTKLRTYPLAVDRLARAEELAAASDRLRGTLPPEAYEDLGWHHPLVREEIFTREVLVLSVFGPGVVHGAEEGARLFAWMEPRCMEEAVLTSAAGHVLGLAARISGAIAQHLLDVARETPRSHRLRILESLARGGGRGDLVVGALSELFDEAQDGSVKEDASLVLATDLLGELLQSQDAATREASFRLACEQFLDPGNDSLLRYGLLSTMIASGQDGLAEAVSRALDDTRDPELLTLLSDNARQISASDPALATELFARILAHDGLSSASKKGVLRRIHDMGGPSSVDLLASIADHDRDAGVRAYARELLAGGAR
jgi:hypothetical protein